MLSPSCIYLPPREAEYINSLLKSKVKLKHYCSDILRKYNKYLIRNSGFRRNIKKQIQSREEKKLRFSFRPKHQDWIEIQMIGLILGISLSMVVLELIRMDMNELFRSFHSFLENVGMTTFSRKDTKTFRFTFNPSKSFLKKSYRYCNPVSPPFKPQ